MSKNSMTAFCANLALSFLVLIFIPFAAGVEHAGWALGMPSTSTKHILQFAATDSFLW